MSNTTQRFTKDGYLVIASGCAEDNSGIVIQANGKFIIRMTYPIGITEEGEEIYTDTFSDRKEAIEVFKSYLGSFGYGE